MRGHNTGEYYQCLMYVGLRTLGSLHKNSCIGPGLCELPRISLPRTLLNRGASDALWAYDKRLIQHIVL